MLPAPVVPATECIVESDARLPHRDARGHPLG